MAAELVQLWCRGSFLVLQNFLDVRGFGGAGLLLERSERAHFRLRFCRLSKRPEGLRQQKVRPCFAWVGGRNKLEILQRLFIALQFQERAAPVRMSLR